jgi:dTDP-6-deoxy-L-talose 4-dehydrogenase (NAD+)
MDSPKVVAVTGANGYIGRHVVNVLIDKGAEVIAIDMVTDEVNKKAKIIATDVFSGAEDVFDRFGRPDACLHLAWKDGFLHNSNAHMECLSKHFELINNLINGGLKQIAVMGTMHEIGYYEGAVDENTPCNPISMYGIAKDALRRSLFLMIQNNKKDIVAQWLRAYYIYGDDKRNHSIFTKIIQAEENRQETFPFTTGKNKYDFIHIDELGRMLAACVLQKDIHGIINCCTGQPVSLAEKVEGFIKEHNLKIKLVYGVFPDRPYDSPAIWGDNTKILQVLRRE